MPALRQTSPTVVPSSACRRMNAICASLNFDLFMVLPRPAARISRAAKLEFSSKDRSSKLGSRSMVNGGTSGLGGNRCMALQKFHRILCRLFCLASARHILYKDGRVVVVLVRHFSLAALEGLSGEVILADSASSDRTLEIAAKYPIKVVRLATIEDPFLRHWRSVGPPEQCWPVPLPDRRRDAAAKGVSFGGAAFLNDNPDVGGVAGESLSMRRKILNTFAALKRSTLNTSPA
jgi:hypothetical protein